MVKGARGIRELTAAFLKPEDKDRQKEPTPPLPPLTINPDEFPHVPPAHRPRKIVFDFLPPMDIGHLEGKGYAVTCLRTLPRESGQDNITWLLALLQGVTDGTVKMDKARGEATFLDMKARGLFDRHAQIAGVVLSQDGPISQILDWNASQHTLTGNSTIIDPKQIESWARGTLLGTHSGDAAVKAKRPGPKTGD